ncbi:TonB-dependent receptor, partial [bacterium]|nr:TonB-dependent receptor [bacterium]
MQKLIRILNLFVLFCFWVTCLFAGTTGKIAGNVTEASNGHPLAGVLIHIQDTDLEGVTNKDGDYFIINIPPETYTVEARINGYTTLLKSGVIVRTDHTTPIDFSLKKKLLENQETTAAEPEIILQDITERRVIATSNDILEIPFVQDISQFINLQVGVEENLIRGGDLESAALLMDGLMVVDNRINRPVMNVNLSAVQELNVIKDGFNAEYGNVRSGLFNVVTKEGDVDHYHGSVDFRFAPAHYKHKGPNVFDPENVYLRPYLDPAVCYVGTANGTWDAYTQQQNITFIGWDAVAAAANGDANPDNDQTPEQARDMFIWLTRAHAKEDWDVVGANALLEKYGSSLAEYKALYGRDSHEIDYGDKPDINIDASLSGPVPLIGKYLGNLNFFTSYRANWDAWGSPIGWDESYYFEQNLQQKLTTRLSSSMKLTLEGLYGEIRTYGRSRNALSESNYYSSGSANTSTGLEGIYYPAHYPPFGVYRTMYGIAFDHVLSRSTFYNVRISQLTVQNCEYGSFIPDPADMTVKLQDKWLSGSVAKRNTEPILSFGDIAMDEAPYGLYYLGVKQMQNGAYYGSHAAGSRDLGRGITFNAKFDLTSQMDKYNQVKAGFDFTYDDQYTYYHHIRIESEWENRFVEYQHYPYRFGAYLQDKLEFEGMIANLGLRLDYNQPNSDWPTLERYSKYFKVDYKKLLFTEGPMERAKGHLKISPRLGISHPISANAKLYFNYGHFYSMPSSSNMYRIEWGRNSDGIGAIGNPSLDLPKTVAYELGLDYDISNMYLLHLAGYYRDITDQTGNVQYVNYDETISYQTNENRNYQDTRGFEIRVDKRYGDWWTAWAQYKYMITTSGYIGRTAYYEDPNRQLREGFENPQLNRPVSRPSARVNLRIATPRDFGPVWAGINPIGDLSVNLLFAWQAGRVQTWDPLATGELENNLRWKADYRLDIRISKRLQIGKFNFNLFADIQNMLNSELWSTNAYYGDDSDKYLKSLKLEMYGDPKYKDDYVSGGMIAGNDKPGELRSDDKPYINDPNMEHRMYFDIRH